MEEKSPFVQHQLRLFRKRQRWVWLSVACFPAWMYSVHMLEGTSARTFWEIMVCVFSAGFLIPHLILGFECPRCHGPFFADSRPFRFRWKYYPFASRCQNCGLELPPRE